MSNENPHHPECTAYQSNNKYDVCSCSMIEAVRQAEMKKSRSHPHHAACATFQHKDLECTCHLYEGDIKSMKDNINPDHYKSHPSGVECIEITRHMTFNCGNAVKYVWRNGLKDGNPSVQDLKKAVWYLNDEIKRLENGTE